MNADITLRGRSVERLVGNLGREIGAAILLTSVVLFISAMTVLAVHFAQMREGFAELQRSQEMRGQLSMFFIAVVHEELALRGYALSGDNEFLVEREQNHKLVDTAVGKIDALVTNDPVQKSNLVKLRQILADYQAKFEVLHHTSQKDMVPTLLALAKARVRGPVARQFRIMLHEENMRVANREAALLHSAEHAFRQAFWIAGLAFICGVAGAGLTLYGRYAASRI